MNVRRPTRREFLQLGAATALVPGIVLPVAAAADPSRLALVVGNDAYPGAPLSNAVNDAKAMSALLGEAGFGVDLRTNVDRTAFGDATKQFAEAAQKSDVKLVFFYYAGHGAQLDWRNYLLPVDARVNTSADLPAQCVDLASLLTGLARAKDKTFVIVLDACRDNPFGASFRPTQKGLSQFDAPSGSLLAFSTAPGRVAADTSGASAQSGLYAEHLVRELSVRATRLEDALKRVRLAVRIASKGAQVPWESTSLESDVFLFPAARKLTEAELEAEIQRELDTWNRVKGSKETNEWAAFLRDWPSGRFAEIAQTRLAYFAARDEAARAPVQIAAAPAQPALSAVPAQGPAPTVAAPEIVLSEPRVREPAQLVVGSGPDVPVLMRPSANPMSAGTYAIDRGYSVGDEVVYLQSDPVYGGATKKLTWRVTKVDLDADRVEINDGFIVLDSMGNPLVWDGATYEPRLQAIPAEVQVGKRWTTRFRFARGAERSESYYNYVVVARERVKLPFGEIEAFRIDGDGFNNFGSHLTIRHWLVPGINYSLRTDTIRYDGRSLRAQYAERREMVSCRQMRWQQA
jgi:Caspase domain